MRNSGFLFLSLFLLIFVGRVTGQSDWQHDDVSMTVKNELYPDIAVEADGTAHIVFSVPYGTSGRGVYCSNTRGNRLSSPQQISVIPSEDSVIKLDNAGNIHLAVGSSVVAYLNNVEGSFSAPDAFGPRPVGLDMDIDDNSNAHIVFFSLVNGLWHIFYATNISGSFEVTSLGNFGFGGGATGGALFPSIAEHSGIVHIAFKGATAAFSQNIYYINNEGGTFDTEPKLVFNNGPNNNNPTDLVDSMGTVHVIHNETPLSPSNNILHSVLLNDSFETEIAYTGFLGQANPALGPDNEIAIAAWRDNGTIFITNKGGSWTSESVTPAGSGDIPAAVVAVGTGRGIAVDGNGYIHIVGTINRAESNNDIRYHTTNPNFVPGGVTAIADDSGSDTPTEFALSQNYPNPFNPETTIRFSLPKSGHVEITFYNMLGQAIRRAVNEGILGWHTFCKMGRP